MPACREPGRVGDFAKMRLVRLEWVAQGMAAMFGAAGAALVAYVDLPEPERVAPPIVTVDFDPMQGDFARAMVAGGHEPCARGYSSASSGIGLDARQVAEFMDYVCAGQTGPCEPLPPETAVCVAEERFLGEGMALSVSFVANPFAWVVSGEGQRVFVDVRSGDALSVRR